MFANVSTDPLAYIESLKEYVESKRQSVSDESNIQNEIDAIVTLMDSTIYKLTFLR
jgi:hypothetical protein